MSSSYEPQPGAGQPDPYGSRGPGAAGQPGFADQGYSAPGAPAYGTGAPDAYGRQTGALDQPSGGDAGYGATAYGGAPATRAMADPAYAGDRSPQQHAVRPPAHAGETESEIRHSDPEAYEQLRRRDDRSLGDIMGDLTDNVSRLVSQELALFKAEATQTAKNAGAGVGMLVGTGLAALFVLSFLSWALWWGLARLIGDENGLAGGWAALIVAVVWAIVGAILYSIGRNRLKAARGVPQTTDTVKKIPNALIGDEEKN